MRLLFLFLGVISSGLSTTDWQFAVPINARVTIFLSTECPISQRYAPRLTELHREFAAQGVSFAAYFPLRTDDYRALTRFRREYPLPFPIKPDSRQVAARRFQAKITPEVVVQDAQGTVVYQGAIDDWFVSLGKHRPEVTQHYLRDALRLVLAGRVVVPPKTEAIGCFIE
jgi:thiol-disulfide isomerase/thioredoxin